MAEELTSGDAAVGAETPAGSDTEAETDDTLQAEGTEGETETTETDAEGDDDFEDFEHEGEKYRVPKALKLKDGYLRQADYTRKTQELAEARRAHDAERETFTKSREAQKAYETDVGRLGVLDEQIAYYQRVDWPKLQAENNEAAQQHWMLYQQLKDQRGATAAKVAEHQEKAKAEGESARSKRLSDTVADLQRNIPGWDDKLAGKTIAYAAAEVGLTEAEAMAVADLPFAAKLIRLVHGAMTVSEAAKKAKVAIAAAKPNAEPKPAVPIKQVTKQRSGPAPSTGPSDNDSIEVWNKKREAQIAKQNAERREALARRRG